ncbi:hypothetical protein ACJIZ3_007381 [Penstemon smallii]|uniref:Pentatricopeptide repeat-containing protein n=1 Tax=Penstemon smallii TaxID=265156 RepID=A0ABD3SAK7_9LAMI
MNKLLHEKKNYPEISENWKVFAMLAKGYLKVGQAEKSREMLREIEKRIDRYPSAYRTLVSMYADLGDIEEVYRVWNLMKNEINIRNTDYYNMISSLVRVDDFDGAEEILKEWESSNRIYDFRIPRLLIKRYVEKGFFGKAEEVVKKIIVSGNKPPASIWGFMATGYSKSGRMDKALDAMTEAILSDQDCWTPNRDALKACMGYLKKKGEDELVEGLCNLLSERRILSRQGIEGIRYEVEVLLIKPELSQ